MTAKSQAASGVSFPRYAPATSGSCHHIKCPVVALYRIVSPRPHAYTRFCAVSNILAVC